MEFKPLLHKLISQQNLTADEMSTVMHAIMTQEVTDAQMAALLVALNIKGETATEISAAAKVLRTFTSRIFCLKNHLVDIVGTGGDGANSFNVSTASSFVAAACGATVIKHGNRAVSSKSGSADFLEAAGVNIHLNQEQTQLCIEQLGIGFLFAPLYHPAMKHLAPVRQQLSIKTLFNLLGPLINPAQVPNMLLGVSKKSWLKIFAEVCKELKAQHVLVVHSEDGLDEISIAAPTHVAELQNNQIHEYVVTPEQFGLVRQDLNEIKITSAAESVKLFNEVLENKPGAARDIILLNAGSALYSCGVVNSIEDGIRKASQALANGEAKKIFQQFVKFTQSFKGNLK